jgi:hypothetical protein
MAQPLQNITIAAPAFKGLNTQDSPLSGDPQYASVADNMIIDTFGRIGSRKGFATLTGSSSSLLSNNQIETIHEYEDQDSNTEILSIGNGKVFKGTTTLTDITPSGYIVGSNKYTAFNFNDKAYFFSSGQETLVYNDTDGLQPISSITGASSFQPQGNVAISAFGRLWVVNTTSGYNKVYWSDLLIGHSWTTGSSGSLDLDKVWPDGADQITALAVWNNYLVIFGRNSIVLYQNASSPANMSLVDTVSGVGCVAQETVKATGSDLLFLSSRGVMALGRTIQEKSNPISDISRNVRDDLLSEIGGNVTDTKAVYSPKDGFYLLFLTHKDVAYCFDTKGTLENGAFRATRWTYYVDIKSSCVTQDDRVLFGSSLGLSAYTGYVDHGFSYPCRYHSNPLSFGDPSRIKFLKKIVPTIIGAAGSTCTIGWSYDFSTSRRTSAINIPELPDTAEFGVAEFNTDALYTNPLDLITSKRINGTGSGNLLKIIVDSAVKGNAFSLQEINIQVLIGRTY